MHPTSVNDFDLCLTTLKIQRVHPRISNICAIFSSPEPKARVSYCHCASSVVRPSGVNNHIFDFSSETVERNSTKLYRKQDLNALYQVCVFLADRKNKMAALAPDWLGHFRLLLWMQYTVSYKIQGYFPKLKIVWSGFPLFTCINDWNSTNF